ncbi:MAG: hypothetical protein IPM84_20870 [Anaerolineae bacterium]|nr:hypothetical protein [Anaerolineae bacterium]MBK9095163.1 hypothetical protein [Anaerolineae bacterium]
MARPAAAPEQQQEWGEEEQHRHDLRRDVGTQQAERVDGLHEVSQELEEKEEEYRIDGCAL